MPSSGSACLASTRQIISSSAPSVPTANGAPPAPMVSGASGPSFAGPAPPAAPSLETALTAPQLSALSTTTRRRVVVNRILPVHSKNSDPKECLDRIDDMYQLYYDLEVCSGGFHFFTLSRLVQSAWAPSPRLFRVEEVHCAHPISPTLFYPPYVSIQDKYSPKPYMDQQKDINKKMRSILVDWLVEVHHRFKLQPFTLWLCVNILDRYLMLTPTNRNKLQLVGVSALLIACKYEEIYPPEVNDCIYITDNAYERTEVLKMESNILMALDYQIFVPTGYHFLARYLNCIAASERLRHLAAYYAERNLQEFDSLYQQPHLFAAAAIYAALYQQRDEKKASCWCFALQQESGLTEADVLPCARQIIRHVREEPETASKRRLVACKKKFTNDKFLAVANLPLPAIPESLSSGGGSM